MSAIVKRLREWLSTASLSTAVALSIILALAAALRFWGWDYGLPHPRARPDEEFVLESVFQMFAQGRPVPLTFAYPHLPIYIDVLVMHIYFKVGELLGNYDRTMDMLVDIVVLRPGLHYRIARAVSLVAGVATVAATYFLGKVSFGKRSVGLLAALLVSTSLLHVITSRFATVDCMMALFVTLALVFAVKAAQDGRVSSFAIAGAFVGLAGSSKYNGVFVCLSLVAPVAIALFSSRREDRCALVSKLTLAGLCACLAFALTSPYAVLRYREVQTALTHLRGNLGAGSGVALFSHLRDTFPIGLGWPFYLTALVGVARGLWYRRPAEIAMLGFAIPFLASMTGVTLTFPRYVVPIVPVMAVLSAELVLTLLARSRLVVSISAVCILVAPGLASSVRFDQLASRTDTRVLTIEWLGENLPPRSGIAVCGGYGAPKINTDRRRPPVFEPVVIPCSASAVTRARVPYLITNEFPPFGHFLSNELEAMLAEKGRALIRIDPFRENPKAVPRFFADDMFYLPLSGFTAMERGGPIITVWHLD